MTGGPAGGDAANGDAAGEGAPTASLRLIGHRRTRRAGKAQRSTARARTHAAEAALQHFRNFTGEVRQRPVGQLEGRRIEHRDLGARH